MISDCTLRYLGDLPFDSFGGTCNTFNVDDVQTIFLCFSEGNSAIINGSPNPPRPDNEIRKCRTLTHKNNGFLGDIDNFKFDLDFELSELTNSIYDHHRITIANYRGKFNNLESGMPKGE